MNIKVNELKLELKDIAKRIRATKITVKEYQKVNNGCHGANGFLLKRMKLEYRHKHIAYCLYRGRTIKQIENKNKEDNEPDMRYINSIISMLKENEVII